MTMYLLISGILNLDGKLAIGVPSKSSQVMIHLKSSTALTFAQVYLYEHVDPLRLG